jgi:hypothetical protein
VAANAATVVDAPAAFDSVKMSSRGSVQDAEGAQNADRATSLIHVMSGYAAARCDTMSQRILGKIRPVWFKIHIIKKLMICC